tara:strand:+ start:575 stop:724 length:150 start_codon:yes stop_codon:yes gene_type:complete
MQILLESSFHMAAAGSKAEGLFALLLLQFHMVEAAGYNQNNNQNKCTAR